MALAADDSPQRGAEDAPDCATVNGVIREDERGGAEHTVDGRSAEIAQEIASMSGKIPLMEPPGEVTHLPLATDSLAIGCGRPPKGGVASNGAPVKRHCRVTCAWLMLTDVSRRPPLADCGERGDPGAVRQPRRGRGARGRRRRGARSRGRGGARGCCAGRRRGTGRRAARRAAVHAQGADRRVRRRCRLRGWYRVARGEHRVALERAGCAPSLPAARTPARPRPLGAVTVSGRGRADSLPPALPPTSRLQRAR
jgi:hypothetical protein